MTTEKTADNKFIQFKKVFNQKHAQNAINAYQIMDCFFNDVIFVYQNNFLDKPSYIPLSLKKIEYNLNERIKNYQQADDKLTKLEELYNLSPEQFNDAFEQVWAKYFQLDYLNYIPESKFSPSAAPFSKPLTFIDFKEELLDTFIFDTADNVIKEFNHFELENPQFFSPAPPSSVLNNYDSLSSTDTPMWRIIQRSHLLGYAKSGNFHLVVLSALKNINQLENALNLSSHFPETREAAEKLITYHKAWINTASLLLERKIPPSSVNLSSENLSAADNKKNSSRVLHENLFLQEIKSTAQTAFKADQKEYYENLLAFPAVILEKWKNILDNPSYTDGSLKQAAEMIVDKIYTFYLIDNKNNPHYFSQQKEILSFLDNEIKNISCRLFKNSLVNKIKKSDLIEILLPAFNKISGNDYCGLDLSDLLNNSQSALQTSLYETQKKNIILSIQKNILDYYSLRIPAENCLANPDFYLNQTDKREKRSDYNAVIEFSRQIFHEESLKLAAQCKDLFQLYINRFQARPNRLKNILSKRPRLEINHRMTLSQSLQRIFHIASQKNYSLEKLDLAVIGGLFYSCNQTLYGNSPEALAEKSKYHADYIIHNTDALKDSVLKNTVEKTLEQMKAFINQNVEKINCLLTLSENRLDRIINKYDLYFQCHLFTNNHIKEYALQAYYHEIEKFYRKLTFVGDAKIQRESLSALINTLTACKTEKDYIIFLHNASKLLQQSRGHFWDKLFKKTLIEVCFAVVNHHMLRKEAFHLNFNTAQLQFAKDTLHAMTDNKKSPVYKKLAKKLNTEIQLKSSHTQELLSVGKEDDLYKNLAFNKRLQDETTILNINKESNYKKDLFKNTLKGKLFSHYLADIVITADRFILKPADIGMIGTGLSGLAAMLELPGASTITSIFNKADNINQRNESEKILATLSEQFGSLSCWEQMAKSVIDSIYDIFEAQITEMKSEDARRFGEFCHARIYSALHKLAQKDDQLSLHEYLVLSVFREDVKLTKVPWRKDHYTNESDKKFFTKTTFQGLVDNIIHIHETGESGNSFSSTPQFYAALSAIGLSEKNEKPKNVKYGFTKSRFFAKNPALLEKIARYPLKVEKKENSFTGTFKENISITEAMNRKIKNKKSEEIQGEFLLKSLKKKIL